MPLHENTHPESGAGTQLVCVTRDEIDAMEKRTRVKFANSLPGFKSLALVGTQDAKGKANLAIASSITHLGSDPPLLGMVSRPTKVPRHTLENILSTGVYTFNHVRENFFEKAHQTSARYGREISEFEAVGLNEARHGEVEAPFVGEAHFRVALRLVETLPVQANGVVLVVGEVTHVFYPPSIREEDGFLDLAEAGTLMGAGTDGYFRATRLERLSYAKPDRPLRSFEPGIGEPTEVK